MNGNDFVNGLKSKDYELYKKVKESINYSKRMFIRRGGVENIDYVVCQVCDCIKYGNFTDHLTLHSISLHDYQTMFPDVLTVPQKRRDRVTGENNPSFNHGGKYSPWSEKSIVHSKEQIKQSKRKAKLNHTSIRTIKYWTGLGYTQEQAIERLGKFQARDLDFFINKYGEEEGYKKWQHKKDKWLKTLSEKTDEEKRAINRKKLYKNGSVSKGEKELFNQLCSKTGLPLISQLVLNRYDDLTKIYSFDICFQDKIIEYNGDFWHANPEKYNYNDYIKMPQKTIKASEIWESDLKKIECAKQQGYKVLIVWEHNFKNNKDSIIEQCINFLTQ